MSTCDDGTRAGVASVEVVPSFEAHETSFEVTLTSPDAVAVACTHTDDPDEVHLVESPMPSEVHTLQLTGLRASSTYDCRVVATCSRRSPEDVVVQTREPDPLLPGIEVQTFDPRAGREYVLTNHNGASQRLLVFDREGHVRWRAQVPASGPSIEFHYHGGEDGFVWGGGWPPNSANRPRRLSVFGAEERYDTAAALGDWSSSPFHHDGKLLSDGRFLTLEEVDNVGPTTTFRGFRVRRVDPVTATVDFDYDSQRAVDEGHLPEGPDDAWHANWVDVDPVDGEDVLFVSLCFLSQTVAIDVETGAWRWRFGPGGDFTLVDLEGVPLPDEAYPQCQHGLQKRGDRLLVYDNGWQRGHSRAAEYALDEESMTATLLWTWTEPEWFERSLGSVDWLADERVLVGMGHLGWAGIEGDHSTIVEIDPTDGAKLWEARYATTQDLLYRASAADPCALFSNAAYCDAVRARLDDLAAVLDR